MQLTGRSLALAAAAALASCTSMHAPSEAGDPRDASFSLVLTQEQASGLLALVNDCAIGLVELDVDAALDARAARNIVGHRDGADATCGSDDDDAFDDIPELDAVPYVGDSALLKLVSYATQLGYIEEISAVVEGVSFTASQMEGVLSIANGGSLGVLDDDVALDARAAEGIVQARPFDALDVVDNMRALSEVSYVGASALTRLRDFVPRWTSCDAGLAGTFETVVYTALQAHDVLDLVNRGSSTELSAITGIGPAVAARVAEARPYAAIDDIGSLKGVGATLLGSLRDQVTTRWCPSTSAACGCLGDPCDASSCDDANPCTDDVCAGGQCVSTVVDDETECGDGRVCEAGACVDPCGGCDEGETCRIGVCFDGACEYEPAPDGTACDEVEGGECLEGECVEPSGCPVTMADIATEAVDDFNELLVLTTFVDEAYATVHHVSVSECPHESWWLNDYDQLTHIVAAWNHTFFIPWDELPDDYKVIGDFTPGSAAYRERLASALTVIDEHLQDGDFDPTDPAIEALYEQREAIVAAVTPPEDGCWVEATMYLDLSECSREGAVVFNTCGDHTAWMIDTFGGC